MDREERIHRQDEWRIKAKELKIYENISYKKQAENIGIRPSSFYHWLKGEYELSEETLCRVKCLVAGENNVVPVEGKRIIPVDQYTLDGKLIHHYRSMAEAARAVGVNPSSIKKNLQGKSANCANFIWRYSEIEI